MIVDRFDGGVLHLTFVKFKFYYSVYYLSVIKTTELGMTPKSLKQNIVQMELRFFKTKIANFLLTSFPEIAFVHNEGKLTILKSNGKPVTIQIK